MSSIARTWVCLFMGNMDALRDWGHAKTAMRVRWIFRSKDRPQDYVIATGVQCSDAQITHYLGAPPRLGHYRRLVKAHGRGRSGQSGPRPYRQPPR
jgi:hypothetical protein